MYQSCVKYLWLKSIYFVRQSYIYQLLKLLFSLTFKSNIFTFTGSSFFLILFSFYWFGLIFYNIKKHFLNYYVLSFINSYFLLINYFKSHELSLYEKFPASALSSLRLHSWLILRIKWLWRLNLIKYRNPYLHSLLEYSYSSSSRKHQLFLSFLRSICTDLPSNCLQNLRF